MHRIRPVPVVVVLLFGVEPEDPWTLAAVALLTLAAGAAGALAPARTATRVDPMETLRSE